MKKLFISQPMRGKTNEEILAVREKAIASAERNLGEKVEVIDSFFQNAPAEAKPLWFLGKSLELLSTADVAYFAKGWEDARGCRIENTCAIEYGAEMPIQVIVSRKPARSGALCECSLTGKTPAFQAGDEGSSPFSRSSVWFHGRKQTGRREKLKAQPWTMRWRRGGSLPPPRSNTSKPALKREKLSTDRLIRIAAAS